MVEDYRWLGLHCVRRFKHKGEPTDDLEQVAMVGLLKAVERFDPGYGYTFSTYAVPTTIGELRRHFRDRTWPMRVPRRAKHNYLAIRKVADELQPVFGRSPTIPEIARHVGLSVEDTLEALEAGASYRGVPLDPLDEHDDDHGDAAGCLGIEEPGYVASEARMLVPGLLATLPTDRERQIIKLRFRPRHDPVADRRRARHQPGARLPAAPHQPEPDAPAPRVRAPAPIAPGPDVGRGSPRGFSSTPSGAFGRGRSLGIGRQRPGKARLMDRTDVFTSEPARRPVTVAGILLGAGLGGFVDGIVLHQILQWHHLLTAHGHYGRYPHSTVADLEDNTRWDGIFHTGTWLLVVGGLFLLVAASSRAPAIAPTPRTLAALLLIGWGLFNVVEGVVDHHLLTLHHVRDDVADPLGWDLAFLAAGSALIAIGLLAARRSPSEAG